MQFLVYNFCFDQTSENKYFIWKDYSDPILLIDFLAEPLLSVNFIP
jgi:hypothetical protein